MQIMQAIEIRFLATDSGLISEYFDHERCEQQYKTLVGAWQSFLANGRPPTHELLGDVGNNATTIIRLDQILTIHRIVYDEAHCENLVARAAWHEDKTKIHDEKLKLRLNEHVGFIGR